MEKNAVQYQALNEESYNSLAAYASTLKVNVQLFPARQTVNIDKEAADEVGKFIDDAGLDFHIGIIDHEGEDIERLIADETIDPGTLRAVIVEMIAERKSIADENEKEQDRMLGRIAECEKTLAAAIKDKDTYSKWWQEANSRQNRIKKQIQAISVLIGSIYPEQ